MGRTGDHLPVPGTNISSGEARCVIANIGDKTGLVTKLQMFGVAGNALVTSEEDLALPLPPNAQITTPAVSLASASPSHCGFEFKGKFKASFVYINGSVVEVIPATK